MRRAIVVLALLLGACGPFGAVRSGAGLCALAPPAQVEAALGASAVHAKPDDSAGHPACEWSSAGAGQPRTMSAALWREAMLRRKDATQSGALLFESELRLLEKDFSRTRVLGGIGDAAVFGFGAVEDERFTGGILVRKGGDVLSLRIDGADPAAFEDVARLIAEKM